mmetsp:Transcript_50094/g.83420  ORF Transcript_50094/g.83420 Transcript_50094/m.83420 type:complete len:118 (+) Transcript_50094:97-450(+)
MDYGDDQETGPKSKSWENELLGCAEECGTFCYAFLCPCFAAGEIYENANLGGCCCGFLLHCLLPPFCHACCVTSKIRSNRGIRGSFMGDCCANTCCSPCQLTRELREVREVREDRGF